MQACLVAPGFVPVLACHRAWIDEGPRQEFELSASYSAAVVPARVVSAAALVQRSSPVPRQTLLITLFVGVGCAHVAGGATAPLPMSSTHRTHYVGRCETPHQSGVLRSFAELTESVGKCALDPRLADLDWTKWSVAALTSSGRVRARGATVQIDYKPQCGGAATAESGMMDGAVYYVVPSTVQFITTKTRGRHKRCSRAQRRGPPMR